jgi:hypothetical protein
MCFVFNLNDFRARANIGLMSWRRDPGAKDCALQAIYRPFGATMASRLRVVGLACAGPPKNNFD